MVIFKCKMCGGTLDVSEGMSVVECEYCGTKQTLPTSHDEVIVNLFNRANNLRLKSEYDKAAEVYEKILDIDNTQAEAHWGVVLCKYGVEYVEDPLMDERIPTCHRTQMESILTDISYQSVLQYADPAAKALYEVQAQEINELQKNILQIVKSEKPFDVFICYKETDASGERTKDSVIANEIYHELTNSGLKVFFAAITLEDKLGQEYEPYIFAALTSAKVMIVLGTQQEYFNAVWVKNEWSRYLHLMKSDRQTKRTLIPCFRDMDAYDLPGEFSHLQALDMANIAFMPDLTRNIKKLVGTSVDSSTEKEQIFAQTTEFQVTPLLKRAFITLEDGDFERSDELLEKVLNLDPENAKAYVGKLMCELRIKHVGMLVDVPNFQKSANFAKALQFADEEYRFVLLDYVYQTAVNIYEKAYSLDSEDIGTYGKIVSQYSSLPYVGRKYVESEDFKVVLCGTARDMFLYLSDYRDSASWVTECEQAILEIKYQAGLSDMHNKQYLDARAQFKKLDGYKDADAKAEECAELQYRVGIDFAKDKCYEDAIHAFSQIEWYKNSSALIKKCEKKRASGKRNRILLNISVSLAGALVIGIIGYNVCYSILANLLRDVWLLGDLLPIIRIALIMLAVFIGSGIGLCIYDAIEKL